MSKLNDTISIKRWQACVLIAMTGFALGNILAKTANAIGI